MKWIDLPPVWLIGALGLALLQSRLFDAGLGFGGAWADLLGGLLVGGGIVLMLLAFYEFRRFKTTVMPHETPARLVTSGIFKRSRNPIYLADVLILAGFIFRWDAVLSLPLIPLLVWVLEIRFIIPEENRMRRKFRADFARYCQKTRRWL
ncbi:MAG: isoprenylcysteine carboxylmethyltransferase family protein [Rhodobacteraceae bacterium]|nr:MAG: isoprenylcysteine carboxylmethyltransferase family protein [Paracoccaceae bacterium]